MNMNKNYDQAHGDELRNAYFPGQDMHYSLPATQSPSASRMHHTPGEQKCSDTSYMIYYSSLLHAVRQTNMPAIGK
jgi:hypothetical protein